MRDNTAIIPIFLNIKVFLLYLVGLYCSLRTGACLRHCLRAVECLFAGAGRTCVALSIAHTSVRPLSLVIASYASLPSSPPFLFSLSLSQNKKPTSKDHFVIPSSRLHHWLPLPQVPIYQGRSSEPLL